MACCFSAGALFKKMVSVAKGHFRGAALKIWHLSDFNTSELSCTIILLKMDLFGHIQKTQKLCRFLGGIHYVPHDFRQRLI